MTRNAIALSLSIALASAAGLASAAEGDMYDMSPAAQGTVPAYEHPRDLSPRMATAEEMELRANHGDTGRGQGSGVMMPNHGEMAAQRRQDERQPQSMGAGSAMPATSGASPMSGSQEMPADGAATMPDTAH